MWVLKKGNQTKNTFEKKTKDELVKNGWKVVKDTLAKEKRTSVKADAAVKDVK